MGRRGATTAGAAALAVTVLSTPAASTFAQPRLGPPPQSPTEVAGVTVVAPVDPRVVSSYPADGDRPPLGVVIIKLVFNQAMRPEAWAYAPAPGGEFPACLARPRLLGDQRTVVLLCSLPGGHSYALQVNATPAFTSRAGRSARPYLLHFSTGVDRSSTAREALAQAGLTDADMPIMDWNGAAGVGVSPPRPADAPARALP